MRELLLESLSWLGYLERSGVLLQLLALLIVLALRRWLIPRGWIRGRSPLLTPLLAIGLALLLSLVLQAAGWPAGLLQSLAMLWLGWTLLDALELWLRPRLPPKRVGELLTSLLRPGYLAFAVVVVVSELDSLADLAAIPLGSLFGVEINLGKLWGSLLVLYLLLIGSGPPAAALAWALRRLLGMSVGGGKEIGRAHV